MDKTKQIALTSSLNKALTTLLSGFEKCKAWTDIGAWLFKVETTLKEFPSSFIAEKLSLAKRLAQCLNPGLHQAINLQSLKVYGLIFETMKQNCQGNLEEYKKMFCEDIGIYSVGLFPFFQNAHQKNKHEFLEIIRNYYVPVGRDLIPCLPGLVLAILPGLEEQSEMLVKDITKTLEALLQTVGRRYFIGSIWMGIMRSQRGREYAIKYLMKLVPKMKSEDDDEEEEEDQGDLNNDSDDLSDDDSNKSTDGPNQGHQVLKIQMDIQQPPENQAALNQIEQIPVEENKIEEAIISGEAKSDDKLEESENTENQIVQELNSHNQLDLPIAEDQNQELNQQIEDNITSALQTLDDKQQPLSPIKNEEAEKQNGTSNLSSFKKCISNSEQKDPISSLAQIVNAPLTQIVDASISQIANAPLTQIVNTPLTQIVNTPLTQIVSVAQSVQTQSEQNPKLPTQEKEQLPQKQLPKIPLLSGLNQQSIQPPHQQPQQIVKSALEMAFQQEVSVQKFANPKKQEFLNTFVVRENLKYIEEDINSNNDEINFPNKSTLIISTILACLQDEKQMVRRNILDFMIQHLRITHPILNNFDKLVLVEGVLWLLIKKDMSVTRRVNIWLFGKPDMDNKYTITENRQFVLELIVEAFKRIFVFENKDQKQILYPLKIMQTFYMEHDHLVELTLSQLSISIIRHIYQHSQNLTLQTEMLKNGKRFMENIQKYHGQLLNSLADEVVKLMGLGSDEEALEIINLIDFTFGNLLGAEESLNLNVQRECLKQSLSRLCFSLSQLSNEQIISFQVIETALKVIFKLLLKLEKIESKIKRNKKKEKGTIQQLSQIKQQVQLQQLQDTIDNEHAQNNGLSEAQQQQLLQQQEQNSVSDRERQIGLEFDEGAEKYFSFYEKLCNLLEKFKADVIYKMASQSVVKIQKFLFDKKSITNLPQWFKCISQSIKITNPNISLIAIESMIEIMISEKIDPIYEQLKGLIIEEAKLKYSNKNEVVAGNDYTKLTLEKLWSLLDFQHFYDRIIDLIINFSKYFPQYFKEVVVSSFQTVSITEKEASIRRFAVFWRLTANHSSQYLLSELNKVGLFIMLDFLDHENPLIRHASKNWLMESVPQFYRVIDPLFEVLLTANTTWYITSTLQLFYTKTFDAVRVNEMFRKLKSILVIASDVFLKYISMYELSPLLFELKQPLTEKTQAIMLKRQGATFTYFSTLDQSHNNITSSYISSNPNSQGTPASNQNNKYTELKMSYLDLLSLVCLRYIQGQALESLSLKFQVENAAVNASACEFLELLITHLEDSLLSQVLCEFLQEPLLTILNHCITNRDFVMQVQLLNVFRIMFFHSSYIKKNGMEIIRFKLVQTLSHQLFIPNILKGLVSSIPYVRSQFISFISASIPLLSNYLIHPTLTGIIQQIMLTYFSLIKHLATTPAQENNDSMVTISKTQITKQPSLIKSEKTVLLIQTHEVVKEDSNIYEIHTVLEGVRTILQFFLKIKTLEEINLTKKETTGGFMNVMKTVLTLGIAGDSVNDKDQDGKAIFTQYTETCNALLQDIRQVVELFANSWQTTPEFIVEFTSFGIRPYELNKYNAFNSILPGIINAAENDKQRVKILIISIIKPLLYEFPKELLNSFISLWVRECAQDPPSKHGDFVQNEFLKKFLEMLTILNIPNDIFLNSFIETAAMERVAAFYRIKNPRGDRKDIYFPNFELAQLETNLLYFLYVYLAYTPVDPMILNKENLLPLWNLFMKAIKVFQPSPNPNTIMWMMDLLYMLSEKYSPKEIITDSKFKSELHDLINQKLMYLSGWVAHSYSIRLNEGTFLDQQYKNALSLYFQQMDQKGQIIQQQQSQTQSQYKLFAPYAPTQYELSLAFYSQIHFQEHAPKNLATQMKEIGLSELDQFIFDKIESSEEQTVIDKYRLLILETLKALSLNLLQNTYSPEATQFIIIRVKEFVQPLYTVIDNKTSANGSFLESCSELICNLLEKAPSMLIKSFRKGILETFNKDNFFSCNKTTLRYWGKILDWVASSDKHQNVFSEYLDKVGLQAGFFQREANENKKKVKAFKRICFIIFYGQKDKYKNQLRFLLDRIADVIKSTDNSHSSLLILILFCLRILILRLSQETLNDLFKQIWPMLLTLLISIYSKPQPGQPPRNPNLMLAGLKLVETLSVAQLDEFFLHQWMFVFDYFGLSIQTISIVEKEGLVRQRGQLTEAQLRQLTKISPFHYQPCLSSCLNEQDLTLKYINSPFPITSSSNNMTNINGSYNFGYSGTNAHIQILEEIDNSYSLLQNSNPASNTVSYAKEQRKIIMTQCKVDDESELRNHALSLCQYLIYNNEHRTDIDLSQIESLIEDDFINLDEFTLKM